jgi:hypothetical protein
MPLADLSRAFLEHAFAARFAARRRPECLWPIAIVEGIQTILNTILSWLPPQLFHPVVAAQLAANSHNVTTDGAENSVEYVGYHIHSINRLTLFHQPNRH